MLNHAPLVREEPVGRALQTVKVTVNARANPVHLRLRSWMVRGEANCTDTALACLMPRVFLAGLALSCPSRACRNAQA